MSTEQNGGYTNGDPLMPVEDLTGGGGQAENPDPAALPAPVGAEAEVAADAAPAAAPRADLGVLTSQVAQILGAVGILGDQLQKLSVRSARQDDELAAQRVEIEQGRTAAVEFFLADLRLLQTQDLFLHH